MLPGLNGFRDDFVMVNDSFGWIENRYSHVLQKRPKKCVKTLQQMQIFPR